MTETDKRKCGDMLRRYYQKGKGKKKKEKKKRRRRREKKKKRLLISTTPPPGVKRLRKERGGEREREGRALHCTALAC